MNHTNTTHPRNTTTTTTTSTTKISPWNQQQTTNLRNSNNGTTSRSGSNLSSFLTNSKILNTPKTGGATNTNINGASPLSKSVSSDTDAVLHRYVCPVVGACSLYYTLCSWSVRLVSPLFIVSLVLSLYSVYALRCLLALLRTV